MTELAIHGPLTDEAFIGTLEVARAKAVFSVLAEAAELNPQIPLEGHVFTSNERGMAWQQYAHTFAAQRADAARYEIMSDEFQEQPRHTSIAQSIGMLTIRDVKAEIIERTSVYTAVIDDLPRDSFALREEDEKRLLTRTNNNWQLLQHAGNEFCLASISKIVQETVFANTLRRLSVERSTLVEQASATARKNLSLT